MRWKVLYSAFPLLTGTQQSGNIAVGNKMKVLYFAKIPGALFIFYIVFNLIVSVFGLNEFSIQGYIMPNVHGNIIGEIVLILLIFGLSIGIIQRKIKNYEVI